MEAFDDPMGQYSYQDVRDIEDRQCDIEIASTEFEIFDESVNSGVFHVASIDWGKKLDGLG